MESIISDCGIVNRIDSCVPKGAMECGRKALILMRKSFKVMQRCKRYVEIMMARSFVSLIWGIFPVYIRLSEAE
jgi:hypothetical protein